MPTPKELEDQLREGLQELYTDVSGQRERGVDRDKIQREIERKLGEWSMTLHEGEQDQIRDCVQHAEAAYDEVPEGGTIEEIKERALRVFEDYKQDIPLIREQMHHLRGEMIQGIVDVTDGREPKVEPIPQPQIEPLHVPSVKGFEFTPDQITPENVSRFFGTRDKARGQKPQPKPDRQGERDIDDEP